MYCKTLISGMILESGQFSSESLSRIARMLVFAISHTSYIDLASQPILEHYHNVVLLQPTGLS